MSKKNIEDVYPLTPLQEGLLFHAILTPKDGAYHDQFSAVLRGPLEAETLARAWRAVAAGHAIFRTAFAWQTGKAPLQVVGRTAETPFTLLDWRDRDPATQTRLKSELVADDARRGFDPAKAPLTRITLARLGDDAWFLLWSRHHLLLDGWSVAHVLREWLAAYQALRTGQPAPLTTARPFREYLGWLQQQDAARAEAFWRAELGDFSQPTPLGLARPPDTPLPAGRERHGELTLMLDAAESEALRSLARAARVTLATVVQGAWALLLARLGGERDVVFGNTVSGRPPDLPGADGMVGLFINTLPLRARIAPARPVGAWLRDLQAHVMAAREFEHTPLVKIHGWTEVPRDHALFETLLVFENYPIDEALAGALGEIRVEQAHSHERTHYPATMIVAPGAAITLLMLHDRARLPDDLAARWLEYFRALLAAFAGGADQPVGLLHGLTGAERAQVLTRENATARDHDRAATLADLFAAQVARTPAAVALIDGAHRLSYAEVARRAVALAARLRELGAGPERCVGVCLERGAELVIALLGVLESGAAYVPLDPTYPAERLAFMFGDAQLAALVTQRSLAAALPAHAVPTVWIDEVGPDVRAGRPENFVRPENLAYLIYTSGSTGRPKATAIEHRQAVAFVHWAQSVFTARELAGVLFSTSVCFDLSVFEIFVTLASGGAVIVAENALALPTLPARAEVTLINTVPSAAAELARQDAIPSSIVTINLAGEPLTAALADRLYGFASVERVYDLYGPSEDTTYSTCALRTRGGPATIGRVIANSRLYLVDPDLQPVPAGAIGEILLAGEGLARGYLGRPDLTAERFVPDPFSPEPGGRLYRTGDLGRFRGDEQLEYLGRGDHQIKIRGFRVELGEIQARLEAHADVAEAAVVAREHPQRGKYLAAFVAAKPGSTSTSEILARWLGLTLPHYMQPATWHFLKRLPRTPNGKLDRKALPPDRDDHARAPAVEAGAGDPVEEIVAGIWTQVLGVARVRREDNFFDLGGHSLLATQVVARVRAACKVEIPLRLLFDCPTAGGFASGVRAARVGGVATSEAPIGARAAGVPAPLSLAQQRLWVLARLAEAGAAYHLPAVFEAHGELDVAALERALNGVIARHEGLRTVFPERLGQATAEVLPAAPIAIAVEDFSRRPESERLPAARRTAAAQAAEPFDLARGPLMRAGVVKLGPQRHWLLLTMHHIVTDGWSESVLVRELAALYAGGALAPLTVNYGDYAAWHRRRAHDGELAAQVNAAAEELRGVPVLELPLDRPRPAVSTFRGGLARATVPAATAVALRSLARQEGATLFMVLLAAWEVWLWRHTGQLDFAIGTPVAGRVRPELEDLIGLFVNTLVLRADVAPGLEFAELVRRVRARTLRAHDRGEAPFEQVIEAVNPERDVSRAPLCQVMFSVQNTPRAELALGALRLEAVTTEVTTAKFELSLTAAERADGTLALGLEHNRDLFDAATAERFLARYVALLGAIVAAPKAEVRALAWVPEPERAQVAAWSRGPAAGGALALVPQAITAQATRTPDAVAVALGDASWTHAELQSRAAQMAARLHTAGVGRGGTVAVLAEREPAMVAALLGAWRVGAAYVPLDSESPPERLRAIVGENRLDAVLLPTAMRARLPAGLSARVIAWDDAPPTVPAVEPVRMDGADVAYVLFTSGSTGQPKGVAIPHGALANHMAWFNTAHAFGPRDVVLQKTPFTFDASVWEFWAPLMTGGRLELAAPGAQRDPAALVAAMRRAGVTVLQAVPTLLERLAAEPGFAAMSTLRILFSGGEPLTAGLRDRLTAGQRVPLVNLYGPTEATIECAEWMCSARDGGAATIPLGPAAPGCALHVLDAARQPVAAGVAGELFVGGAQLAQGYWRQPALTAERFWPDPFSPEPGARLYATGDLVRWRGDGVLEYLGRTDDQVKLRGFRVELGEVEAAMAAAPGVVKAAAAVRDGQLTGYVEWPGAPRDWMAALRSAVAARLPHYMVPARFAKMETWPLLASGKVDRRALPEAPAPEGATGPADAAPAGMAETLLAGLWREFLRVPRVGRHDNFFALGGDSILALQIAARAAAAGLRVPAQAVFQHQTLAELAATVTAPAADGAARESVAMTDAVPLTPIQQWFFAQEFTAPAHWNQSALFVVPADFDGQRFAAALRRVAARHDALQLRYTRAGEDWCAVAGEPGASVAFATEPLADLAGGAERAQAALDLAAGPLLRAVHFADAAGGAGRLLLVVHHLAIDGVSWRVLLEELAAAYAGRELPVATARWGEWARALAAQAAAPETLAELPHWRAVPATRLPRDFAAAGRGVTADEDTVEVTLSRDETQALLTETAEAYRTQINDLLLTALARALAPWTGATAHTIALEGHGREEFAGAPDVARTVGWFTTLFPVALDAGGDAEPGSALKRVKEQLRAVPRRGLGYGLLRHLGPPAAREALGAQPAPELCFNYLGQLDAAPAGDSATTAFAAAAESHGADHGPRNARAFLVEINAAVRDGAFRATWHFSRAHHRRATVARVADDFGAALRALIAHCRAAGTGGFTPSDFSAPDVSQDDLDKLLSRLQ